MGKRAGEYPKHHYRVILQSGHVSVVECARCGDRRLMPERFGEPSAPPCKPSTRVERDAKTFLARECLTEN